MAEMDNQINSLQETITALNEKIAVMEDKIGTLALSSSVSALETKFGTLPKLTQMTVTDKWCRIEESIGTIVTVPDPNLASADSETTPDPNLTPADSETVIPDPYLFYASETLIWTKDQTVPAKEIQMVQPLGGSQSGLYRFPRVGEDVLVAETSRGNFLMGYVPSRFNPFFGSKEKENITGALDEMAEVLRYQKTGPDMSDSEYSEIGFYKHEADWPIKDGEEFVYPPIDRINIQSTGDIRSTAENHHLIQAKRFEILAGCPEVNHRTDRTAENERPLGDNLGDDSALHGGDVHIRAGNRVVVKAEQEICLQVGRTVLSLSDQGFSVKSKVTNSNFENVMDATLGLSPRDGINMFGYNVNVSSAKGFQLGDSYGGSISSTIGVVGVNGREVKLAAYDSMEYAFTMLYALFQVIQCSASGGAALAGAQDVNTAQYVNFTFDMVQRIIEIVKNVYEGYQARQKTKEIEDEDARVLAAEAELARAREEAALADKNAEDADADLKKRQEAADQADKDLQKAREDAANKKKEEDEALARKEEAARKKAEDDAAAQKARDEKAAAEQEAARKQAEADTAESEARAAKDQADADAAEAAEKKRQADEAQAEADKAGKTVKRDEQEVAALEERVAANEQSAERHNTRLAEAEKREKDQLNALLAMAGQAEEIKKTLQNIREQQNEQKQIIDDPSARKKQQKDAQKKQDLLDVEGRLTQQSSDALDKQVEIETYKLENATNEKNTEKANADAARQSASQKQGEADNAKSNLAKDRETAAAASENASGKKSVSDDAQNQAAQSKQRSDEADSSAQAKRQDADNANADLKEKTDGLNAAETKKQQSATGSDAADADHTAKRQDRQEADAAEALQQQATDDAHRAVDAGNENLQASQAAQQEAANNLAEKEKQAAEAKAHRDATLAETRSSGLTDEFDQAIDVDGEKVHYERPDYDPDTAASGDGGGALPPDPSQP
jgi:hypothetical protein